MIQVLTLLWEEMTMNLLEKLMSIINKQKQAILFSQKIKRLYEKLANVIIVTIKQKYQMFFNVNYLTGVMIFQNI